MMISQNREWEVMSEAVKGLEEVNSGARGNKGG